MWKIDESLLGEQTWAGMFFPPHRRDMAFGGTISYSPKNGLRIEYAIPRDPLFQGEFGALHGVTNDGVPCTLIGRFLLAKHGQSFFNDVSCWTSSGYPFWFLVFGVHCDADATFDGYQFDIAGVREFFAPSSSRLFAPYRRDALFQADIAGGTVEAFQVGTFDFVPVDIRCAFYHENDVALSELQEAYDKIKQSHDGFNPYLKRSIDYRLEIKPGEALDVESAFNLCEVIADLFALLRFSPAMVSRLNAVVCGGGGRQKSLPVIVATLNDSDAVDRSREDQSHHHLPLTYDDVDISALISAWVINRERFDTIVSMVQSKGRLASPHAVLSSIVLSAAQMEDMAYEVGQSSDRYGFAVRTYASQRLQWHLAEVLSCKVEDLGIAVSDLRNDIAHVARPKKVLVRLSSRQRFVVSIALETIVAGYSLESVGLDRTAREKFQDLLILSA